MSNVELLAGIILLLMAGFVILWIGAWVLDFLGDFFDGLSDMIAFPFRRYRHHRKCNEQECIRGCLYYGQPRPKETEGHWEERRVFQQWTDQEKWVNGMEEQGKVTPEQASSMRTYCREQRENEIKTQSSHSRAFR
jgi:hypothetical protein